MIVGAGADSRSGRRSGSYPHTQLGPYYERAAVVCVPSRREGYGFVAHEAMAYGRPVVATAVGGLVDTIEDGVTGLLVEPRRLPGLRAAVSRLLADAELRRRLGAEGRARAEASFSLHAAAQLTVEAYELGIES